MGRPSTLAEYVGAIGLDPKKDLVQYGVRGMKWGVRKRRSRVSGPEPVTVRTVPGKRVQTEGGRGRPPTDDAKKAAALKQKARASTIDSLSNSEIQTLVTRMNLEQQYARLNPPKQNPVMGFVRGIAKTEVEAMQKGRKGPGLTALESAMAGDGYVGKRRAKK